MRKLTFRICENIGADQLHSNYKADQCLCFPYTVQFCYFLNPKFPASIHLLCLPLSIFCACTAWFVLNLFRNIIVGFLMMWLIYQTRFSVLSGESIHRDIQFLFNDKEISTKYIYATTRQIQDQLEFVFYVKTDVSPLSTCMSKICMQEL